MPNPFNEASSEQNFSKPYQEKNKKKKKQSEERNIDFRVDSSLLLLFSTAAVFLLYPRNDAKRWWCWSNNRELLL